MDDKFEKKGSPYLEPGAFKTKKLKEKSLDQNKLCNGRGIVLEMGALERCLTVFPQMETE